jgi:hypothetical protein
MELRPLPPAIPHNELYDFYSFFLSSINFGGGGGNFIKWNRYFFEKTCQNKEILEKYVSESFVYCVCVCGNR